MLTGEFGNALGASNEFTLRLNFRDHNYFSNARNARQINTSAVSLRRKTLSKYPASKSPYSFAKQNKKFANRNYHNSPNYRMDSGKKLNTYRVKKRHGKKPAYRRNR